MRKALTSIITILLCASMWAVPAYRGWQTKTQPDGREITVRQIGDEFYHYWETEDGMIALEQADGTFVKTSETRPSDEQINTRRAASPMYKPRKSVGHVNLAPRGLLILVQFSDVTFADNNNQAAFNDMLNSTGYNYNGATGSAVEYFKAQSNNQYTPIFDVVGPVTLNHPCIYYGEQGDINGSQENDMYLADFVLDAVLTADSLGCDFSQYDGDNDGKVDFVYFIYAGKGQAAGGETWTIWPHNWTLYSACYFGLTHGNSPYCQPDGQGGYNIITPVLDGKKISNYACSAELRSDGNRSGIGTFCHEFGHVMGLPDYYVTASNATNYNKKYTPGAWSIMDYGSYNNNEMTPPNYSPHDKFFFGWSTPKLLKKDAKRDVTLTTDYNSSYQITGTKSAATATTEERVWYLENRQKNGWDKYLPGHGMLIWEVTYNNTNWLRNEPNNEDIGYTIVTANNTTRPYKPCFYHTNDTCTSGTTFPGRNNVTAFTPADGCAITNIAENNGVITFKYNGGDVNYWTYEIDATHCTASSASGEVNKSAALNLTVMPDEDYTLDNANCWIVEMGDDLLEYGIGFTYDPSNGTFNIPVVTDDVYIIASAQEVPKIFAITINETTNGSVTTNPSDEAEVGDTVTIIVSPAEHYHLATLTVTDAENVEVAISGEGNTRTFIMPEKAVAISATFEEDPKYTVRFFNAGEEISSTIYYVGQTAVKPADPTPECEKYTFVGWWTAELAADNHTAQAWITDFTVNGAQDYYAIYRMTEDDGEMQVTDAYKKITTLDELTTGNYVVAGNSAHALQNKVISSYYLGTSPVSPVNDIISNPAADIIWEIARSGNSISFFNEAVMKFAAMYLNGTYRNLRMQEEPNWFTPTVTTDGNWSFESNDCSGYYMVYWIYNNTTHEFSARTSSSNTIQLFKQQEESSTTYYSSVINCSADIDEIKDNVRAIKQIENGQLLIIRGNDKYTIFGQKIN